MQNNLFFELMPLFGFFGAYYLTKDIFIATTVCIILSWLQIIIYKILAKPISKNTWLSTILITVFGGLSVAFHNKTFVMLKPTVLYWILAATLLVTNAMQKNLLQIMLKDNIKLDKRDWSRLNLMWVGFFTLMGCLNLFIAFHYSEDLWVKFKVFGGIGMMLIFTLISGLFIYSKVKDSNELR